MQTPPEHVAWEPDFAVGHPVIDGQHHALLMQCERLSDAGAAFDQALDRLKALARQHFEIEGQLLGGGFGLDLEDHRAEREEFEYLVGEIATHENFDATEIQRFLSRWWVGHIAGLARQLREMPGDGSAPG